MTVTLVDCPDPGVLAGRVVRLEPLAEAHAEELWGAAQAAEIWPLMLERLDSRSAVDAYVQTALAYRQAGTGSAFAVRLLADGQVIGSSRYLEVSRTNHRLEIGGTWYHPRVWGTKVNPETKLLLLRYAFAQWQARRVQLKTDALNVHSQAGIRKLGAIYEGTLRAYQVRPDGSSRDTTLFSITADQWPAVEARLLARLGQ